MDEAKKHLWANFLRWTGRVWSVPAILFMGAHLFSPEVNPEVEVYWYEWLAVGLLFASVFALLPGWWKEKIGGWISLGLLGIFFVVYAIYTGGFFPAWWLLLAGIAVPAGMFLGSAWLRA